MTIIKKERLRTHLFFIVSLIAVYFILLHGLSLHKAACRPRTEYKLSETTIHELFVEAENKEDVDEIIKFCCDFVCKRLSFHYKNDLNNGKANCVGYAQYTSQVLNQVFSLKGISCTSRPVVGSVYLYGVNLHPILLSILPKNQSSFFKDHDFVEIVFEDGSKKYVDTSLQDLTGKMISSEPKMSASAY